MNYMDPERLKRRRMITALATLVVIATLVLGGVWALTHYRRTSSEKQSQLLNSSTPTVVMFYSDTCKYCRKVAIGVHEDQFVASFNHRLNWLVKGESTANYVYLEYQNKHDRKLFKQYNVTRTPTFMAFKNGQPQVIGTKNGFPVTRYVGSNERVIKGLFENLKLGN